MFDIKLAARLDKIQPSATLAINQKAAELSRQGQIIISLSAGEPDFPTPAHIQAAAIDAIQLGYTKYTAVDGITPLKQAIRQSLQLLTSISYEDGQIIVSNGAKQCLYNLCQATLEMGDQVIFGAPYWLSYPAMVDLCHAQANIINTEASDNYLLQAHHLQQSITKQSKMVILNSPANPSGQCYTDAQLLALANCLRAHPHLIIVCDDIYHHLSYQSQPPLHLLTLAPDLAQRTIVCDGVSKAYSMTGWRIGYAAGPKPIIQACKKIQSHSTSNPCTISQYAALAALQGPIDALQMMKQAFITRQQMMIEYLQTIHGVTILPATGAFYLWLDIRYWLSQRPEFANDDVRLADWLLDAAKVAVVPGTVFGMRGFLRLSFAVNEQTLLTACQNICQAMQ